MLTQVVRAPLNTVSVAHLAPTDAGKCPFLSTRSVPSDLVVDDFDPLEHDDPDKIRQEYEVLRQKCPLAYTSAYGGYYLLTRYEDIKNAAMNPDLFISSVKAVVPSDPRGLRRAPLNFDAPAHTPYRRALDRTIRPARIRDLEIRLQAIAERELRPLLDMGTVDICATYGAVFPAYVEALWLNLDEAVAPVLAETASKWVIAWRDMKGEEVTRHSAKLYEIARQLMEDRIKEPRDPEDDPASSLLAERVNGEPLDETHLLGCIRQILVVGMVAPPMLLGSICNHLSQDMALQTELRDNPSLIPAAVEEFIRLYSPYRGFARTAAKETSLHGRTIPVGVPITMTYAAANRDPSIFDRPDEFILHRPNIAAHLGFGRGRHRCVGMPLARSAIQIALKVLLDCTASFEVDGPLSYGRMPELGISSCPLKLVAKQ